MTTRTKRRYPGVWTVERIATAAVIVVVIAIGGWYFATAPSQAALKCRARYASARTARDTALVDEMVVAPRPGFKCGLVRRTDAARAPAR